MYVLERNTIDTADSVADFGSSIDLLCIGVVIIGVKRFMDVVISQYDKEYLEALIRYNKALQQRNTLLKAEVEPDEERRE